MELGAKWLRKVILPYKATQPGLTDLVISSMMAGHGLPELAMAAMAAVLALRTHSRMFK